MIEKPEFLNPVFDGKKGVFSSAWQRWLARLTTDVNNLPEKFSEIGPPADGTLWTVTHGLNTTDVVVQVQELSSKRLLTEIVQAITNNQILITLTIPTTANTLRVTVIG